MCEECRHALGTAPNWGQIRADVSGEGRKALAGAAVTILLGVGMVWLGAVTSYLIIPPFAWSVLHARRWYAISKRLAKQTGPAQRG
jgi:hypothetical protein